MGITYAVVACKHRKKKKTRGITLSHACSFLRTTKRRTFCAPDGSQPERQCGFPV